MSKWMQFVFASYAPLVARFHLVESTDAIRAAARRSIEAEEPKCASMPDRRPASSTRRSPKTRKSMAA
jgi:hypothetical protein